MSTSYIIACRETKFYVWIGQGFGGCEGLYTGEEETMENLRLFLNQHMGMPLVFIPHDFDEESHSYIEFKPEHYTKKNPFDISNI